MFMGEVAVQIITEEWSVYWASWLNRIDLVVCVLCVFLYIIFASVEDAPHSHYSVGNYMDALLVGIRYGMQAIRLLRFAQRGRENRQMLNQTEVKFNNERTLSVLHSHGVQMTKSKKKKKRKKEEEERAKSAEYGHYASSLSKWSHNVNKLFNPNFNVLLYGVNSNELRGLKEQSLTESIEMIGINGKTPPKDSPASLPIVDCPQLSESEEEQHSGHTIRKGKELESMKSNALRRRSSAEMNDLASPIAPESHVHLSEAYTTDDVEDHQMQHMNFMYDSEQMALYDNILQNEQTDDTMGPHTPDAVVL